MKRNGFTITEVIAAIVILGVVLGVGLKLMATTAAAEARLHRRQIATQELQNQLQSIETLGWEALKEDEDIAKSLALSDVAKEQLKSVELTVAVGAKTATEKFPESKQVTLTLTWQEPEQQKVHVQLSTWRFLKTEQKKQSRK